MTSLSRYSYRIGTSTTCGIIAETCDIIYESLKPIVFPPFTEESWNHVSADFYLKWNFPNCLGAIDGKYAY